MKKMLKFVCLLIVVLAAITTSSFAQEQEDHVSTVNVTVDGEPVQFPDTLPVIRNGRTLIPLRAVADALNANTIYVPETGGIVIISEDKTVELSLLINSSTISVRKDGITTVVHMDTTATLINSRTCVPIRYVAENLGAIVDFDAGTCTVMIRKTDRMLAEPETAAPEVDYTEGGKYIALTDFDSDAIWNPESGQLVLSKTKSGQIRYATNGLYYRLGYWKVEGNTVYIAAEHSGEF